MNLSLIVTIRGTRLSKIWYRPIATNLAEMPIAMGRMVLTPDSPISLAFGSHSLDVGNLTQLKSVSESPPVRSFRPIFNREVSLATIRFSHFKLPKTDII